jgi:hypothetical protein
MNCKELSNSVVILVMIAVAALTFFMLILTASVYISWLTSDPIECIDSKVYEVTYKGNIKILDEQVGDVCIAEETK